MGNKSDLFGSVNPKVRTLNSRITNRFEYPESKLLNYVTSH